MRSTRCIARAVAACAVLWSAAIAPGAAFTVQWRNQRLTVDGGGVPVVQVLAEIASRTGLQVEGAGALTQQTRVRFSNLPLTAALARLLADVNFAIVERRAPGGAVRRTLIVFPDPARRASRGSAATAGAPPPPDDGGAVRRLDALYEAANNGNLKLLGRAAADPADPSQAAALDLLGQKDPARAVSIAITAAASSDLGQRLTGLQALGRLPGAGSVGALGGALSDPDSGVRETALLALSAQPGPGVTPLLTAAATDPDPAIRALAANLLAGRSESTAGNPQTPPGTGSRP